MRLDELGAYVDAQLRWRMKLISKTRVRGLNLPSQKYRDELDLRAKVEGRDCLFCPTYIMPTRQDPPGEDEWC